MQNIVKNLQALFPPDGVERQYQSVPAAMQLMRERRPDLIHIMADVGGSFLRHFGDDYLPLLERTQRALALSFVRMAYRHGTWGSDFHAYHNESHTLELLNGRLARVRLQHGWAGLEAEEWLLLAMFSTCHDLRQRECAGAVDGVGANERASMAECSRILALAGFDPLVHVEFFDSMAYMIAGSTFDARSDNARSNDAKADHAKADEASGAAAVSAGGSLSFKLVKRFEAANPSWRQDAILRRRHRAILLASDLDTANVGEPFLALASSGERLIREREFRHDRRLDSAEHVPGVFEFLTDGQERYFFKLHGFVSEIGKSVFGLGKTLNAPKLKQLTDRLRERYPGLSDMACEKTDHPIGDVTSEMVIQSFVELASELAA